MLLILKILFLTQRIPYPLDRGDRIRAFHFLKHLSEKHEVTLVSLLNKKSENEQGAELQRCCKHVYLYYQPKWKRVLNCLFAVFKKIPFSFAYFYSSKFKNKVKEELGKENYELIFISSSSMAQYVLKAKTRLLADFVDADSKKWDDLHEKSQFIKRFVYGMESKRIRKVEKRILNTAGSSIITTDYEKSLLLKIAPNAQLEVVKNGVDLERFSAPGQLSKKQQILFIGVMNYQPNVDAVVYFAKEIWPIIQHEKKDLEFCIIGTDPIKEVKKLSYIKGVRVVGHVKDIKDYYAQAKLMVAPFRIARGIQNKVLEAMAMEIPVVGTKKIKKAIGATKKEGLLGSDDPEEFAKMIIDLLKDDQRRERLGAAAREFVKKNYRWEHSFQLLDNIIQQATSDQR